MKRFLSFVLFALLCLPAAAATNPVEKRAYMASVQTLQSTPNGAVGFCSGTAIGPHAVLTAKHCELPTDLIVVRNGDQIIYIKIVERIHDGSDHTIYLLSGETLSVFVPVVANPKIEITENVFTFGNPGVFKDFYQRGYVAGLYRETEDPTEPGVWLYSFPTYEGASGSGVFDSDGNLIDVISVSFPQDDHAGVYLQVSGGRPLAFTQADIDKAVAFVPAIVVQGK